MPTDDDEKAPLVQEISSVQAAKMERTADFIVWLRERASRAEQTCNSAQRKASSEEVKRRAVEEKLAIAEKRILELELLVGLRVTKGDSHGK